MTSAPRAAEVRGKTMRWTWTDGPTKGMTHEHVFHEDGTVEWRAIDEPRKSKPVAEAQSSKTPEPKAKVEYAAVKIAGDVYLVSYLSGAGFTLTVALNFLDGTVKGFASGAKEWHPVQGTFEVVQ